jgi:hypothetical protein
VRRRIYSAYSVSRPGSTREAPDHRRRLDSLAAADCEDPAATLLPDIRQDRMRDEKCGPVIDIRVPEVACLNRAHTPTTFAPAYSYGS